MRVRQIKNDQVLSFEFSAPNQPTVLAQICRLFGVDDPLYISVYYISEALPTISRITQKDYIINAQITGERKSYCCFMQINPQHLEDCFLDISQMKYDEFVIDGQSTEWEYFLKGKNTLGTFSDKKQQCAELEPFFYLRHLSDGETEIISDLSYGQTLQVNKERLMKIIS